MLKRTFTLLFACAQSLLSIAQQQTSTISITFNEADFNLYVDTDSVLHIDSYNSPIYTDEIGANCLPLIYFNYSIDSKYKYKSSSETITKRLIKSNVTLERVPISYTNGIVEDSPITNSVQKQQVWQYQGESRWQDSTIIHFEACPFYYNEELKELYFIDNISANITLEATQVCNNNLNSPKDTISLQPYNPYNIPTNYIKTVPLFTTLSTESSRIKEISNSAKIKPGLSKHDFDYVIVTSQALSESFKSLIQWKKTKGVKVTLVTIESIQQDMPDDNRDLPQKNKILPFQTIRIQ